MRLTLAEKIQVLRRRSGMNQGDFGASAFGTSFESGRTKIKNIELGKQVPTEPELQSMARLLGTEVAVLRGEADPRDPHSQDSVAVRPEILARFPGLEVYLGMLNKAAQLEDAELIDHIAEKIAVLFSGRSASTGVHRR